MIKIIIVLFELFKTKQAIKSGAKKVRLTEYFLQTHTCKIVPASGETPVTGTCKCRK